MTGWRNTIDLGHDIVRLDLVPLSCIWRRQLANKLFEVPYVSRYVQRSVSASLDSGCKGLIGVPYSGM